jgi:WD40 repeat protein/serine/threonine protein kinase
VNADHTMAASKGDSTRRELDAGHQASSRAGNGQWRVGEVVEGLYEVREEITAGAMGLVYRVHHQSWNIDLAVKTPRPELVSSPQRMSDFETEAQTWVQIGLHPHVVACVYVRRIDELPRVFAEWVDGGSLHDAIQSGRLYEGTTEEVLGRILDVAIQFAWGLDYAHSQGLVHQDVKPRNVMLSADWTVKVTDFGLAKARAVAGESAVTGAGGSVLAGFSGFTPAYCSPEQATAAATAETGGRPEPLTRATDVWSWAISVWEMFTGELPVDRGQVAAEAFAAFREDATVEDPRIPAMPRSLVGLLGRCLDPDPATRLRSLSRVADVLIRVYADVLRQPYSRTKPEPAKLVADGLNNQALSLLDLGHIEEAEQLWQQALQTDPRHLHALYNYGLHRWRGGQLTDSALIDELEAVRVVHPGPDVDRFLALVHLERYDTATARALLTAAARRAPDDAGIAAALAVARNQADLAAPRTLDGRGVVVTVAVSADGRIAVSGTHQGDVHVWDVPTGACVRTLTGHYGGVLTLAVSADGRSAVSGSSAGEVRVWDVSTGGCLRTLTARNVVESVAVSADGRTAVSASHDEGPGVFGCDGDVRVWDVPTGACLLRTPTSRATSELAVAVSADGRTAVSGSEDHTVRVWDVPTEAISTAKLRRRRFVPRRGHKLSCLRSLTGHTGPVDSVALSADGRTAVSCGHGPVLVWNVSTGVCLRTLSGRGNSVALSAAGHTAVGGDGLAVRVWDVPTGTCLHTLAGHTGDVQSVAVSADGHVAVSASGMDKTVRVWDVPTARGRRAEWSYPRPQSTQELHSGAAAVREAERRADALLAVGDAAAAAAQLRAARAIPGHRRNQQLVDLWRRLATPGERGELQDAWPQRSLTGHADLVASVALSADGRIAVSGSCDNTVRVWDVPNGSCLHTLTGHTDFVDSVALSADGRTVISGLAGGHVKVWDLPTSACLRTLNGHNGNAESVVLSANGRTAVSAGGNDKTLRVWDVPTGTCLRTLTGHTGSVGSVAVSADGRVAVSSSRAITDTTMRVWDLASGACLRTLTGSAAVSVALNAEATVAVTEDSRQIRVWALDWEYEFGAENSASTMATSWLDRKG